jgi:hypothetical protein
MAVSRQVALALIAVLVSSCAAPAELVRRSQDALGNGDDRRAYELAIKALHKDPALESARVAATQAADHIAVGWRRRIRNLAQADVVAAARECLTLREFMDETIRNDLELPADSAFAIEQIEVLHRAATTFVEHGAAESDAGRPKAAYAAYLEARGFEPGFPGIERMLDASYQDASATVAIFPFQNETRVAGLAEDLARLYDDHVAAAGTFRFTRFIPLGELEQGVTVAEADRGSADAMAEAARGMGADWYVTGRYDGLRVDTRSDDVHTVIFQKFTDRDSSGEFTRYRRVPFDATVRHRDVWVRWSFEVRRTRDASVLARRDGEAHLRARTFYTGFMPHGPCDEYCVAPPKESCPADWNADDAGSRWGGWFGAWELPELLESVRDARRGHFYGPQYAQDFMRDTYDHPVFLDDLPPVDDLARFGLEGSWRDLFSAMVQLDATDAQP